MDLPEDTAPEQRPALITVTDLLGLRSPATELVRAITKGIGNVFDPWLRQRKAKADLAIYNDWKESLIDSEELPSSFEFSIEDRAAIRLRNEARQRQLNRERIAVEAIEDYRVSEPKNRDEAGEGVFDDDWLSIFWQAAEQVSTRDMQSLWGRVLARQASGERKYQLRTLDFLRTLSRSEADDITKLGGFAVQVESRWGTGAGILSRLGQVGREMDDDKLSELNSRLRKCIGDTNQGHLGAIGFYIEDGWAYEFVIDLPDEYFYLQIGSKRFKVSGEFCVKQERGLNYVNIGSGLQISPVGVEVLSLTRAQAQSEYLELLAQGLALQGLAVERE